MTPTSAPPRPPAISLPALLLRFLRFGARAFGGPIAQIGMLRHELVDRERWTSEAHFLRALAVYQALPGPEAHELCCWFGYLARGRAGALVAGLGFLLPGALLVLLGAWLYVEFGLDAPLVAAAFAGLQPAVVALIVRALPRIGHSALRTRWLWCPAGFGAVADWFGLPFWLPLVAGGMFGHALSTRRPAPPLLVAAAAAAASVWLWPAGGGASALRELGAAATDPGGAAPLELLALGLQAGLVTFGGAYTAIPVVRAAAVDAHGWLTDAQFLDGIAVTGVLPAPLVVFCTFTGYVAGGLPGALLMTAGVFAPAFSFTLIGHRFFERIVAAPRLHQALDGVVAGVLGLIAATAVRLCAEVLVAPWAWLAFAAALAIVWGWRSGRAVPAALALGAALGALLA